MAIGFSVPVFFVILRECTEASIVMSVLLTFIRSMFSKDDTMRIKLTRALWAGTVAGLVLSLAIGTAFLVVWFKYASNLWTTTESLWEAIFCLIASILLTGMGLMFLKSDSLMAKWNRKLKKSLMDRQLNVEQRVDNNVDPIVLASFKVTTSNPSVPPSTNGTLDMPGADANGRISGEDGFLVCSSDGKSDAASQRQAVQTLDQVSEDSTLKQESQKNAGVSAFFWIPFVTILREGLEGMVFLGGIAISDDPGHIPLGVLAGIIVGVLIGWVIYRAGSTMKLHTFFVSATILILYLAAGLWSKAVLSFETNEWGHLIGVADADSSQFYNVQKSVWHLSCCDPKDPNLGGWQLFNAIFGWTNSPTIGSIVSYIVYWVIITISLVVMKLMDRRRERLGLEKVPVKRFIKEAVASAFSK
ncbi:iron permease FTR1 family-domain-containing protein [Chytriomyces cf. hyalinus JEL632]|nr:iron permease FTR1 family-domain-containing protein [Chytriomyces cf. hyalinus JEL632]